MKTPLLASLSLALAAGALVAHAAENPATEKGATKLIEKKETKGQPSPPTVFQAPGQPGQSSPAFVYDQKPVGAPPPLVTQEQAQGIIDRFKSAYPKMGNPRLVLFINRELVDEKSGLKMIARTERIENGRRGEKDVVENRYRNDEKPVPALADKQTARDIERLFGRPLRMAGAKLADQRLATQLMPSEHFQSLKLEGEQSRKDREALSKIADVAVEILISSKEVEMTSFNGTQVYAVPDIQATALRLEDAAIVGQASSADLYGGEPSPIMARSYGVDEITEATALALMEDMLKGVEDAPEPEQ